MELDHMNKKSIKPSEKSIENSVLRALEEDIGDGDRTAALIDPLRKNNAEIVCREDSILCGTDWVNKTYQILDSRIKISWNYKDGERISKNQTVCVIHGNTQKILTGERTAINFLQTLSGTATTTAQYVDAIRNKKVKILDTRKTIPGLRDAQKYAVVCGGGKNHRKGLYDGILIKENHILAAGSIKKAVETIRDLYPKLKIEVEVEHAEQISEAVQAGADIVMFDNFNEDQIKGSLPLVSKKTLVEVSGNLTLERIRRLSELDIDFVSVGALTKNIKAIDFSMQLNDKP